MTSLWPWLAVAGVGALHGLNPATGWMLAAAWGVKSADRTKAWLALLPLAAGHLASIALAAAALALGLSMNRSVLQVLIGGLLVVVVLCHLPKRRAGWMRAPASHLGLALWSFLMSTAHGAGLMLVPALIPLCAGGASGREISASGSLAPVLAAVGLHMAAMLAVIGTVASGICRGHEALGRKVR